MPSYRLLTENAAKTAKGEKLGYLTGILYLAPDDYLCPASTPGCRAACLVGSGRARIFPAVMRARQERTRRFYQERAGFLADLVADVWLLKRRAAKMNLRPALRLNGTSDISPRIFARVYELARNLNVRTYEYTKRIELLRDHERVAGTDEVDGYPEHYTFSASESNADEQRIAADIGYPIARVYHVGRGKPLPTADHVGRYLLDVIDGDASDLRFADEELAEAPKDRPYIVGLRLKRTSVAGNAAAVATGFAV